MSLFHAGLQITHNQFVVGSANPEGVSGVWVNESAGNWSSVNQTLVADNVYPPATYGDWKGSSMRPASTQSLRVSVIIADETSSIAFDFSDELLFDCERVGIASAEHSLMLPWNASGWSRGLVPGQTFVAQSGACRLLGKFAKSTFFEEV